MGPAWLVAALAVGAGAAPPPDDAAPAPASEAAPPAEGPAPAPDEDDDLTPAERRRALRRARVKERFAGRVLPPEADFLQRHVDVRARIAFNGTSPGVFSLITSLAGWNELSITADVGVASWKDFTIGVGAGAHVGASLILGALQAQVADDGTYQFGWQMWDAGGLVRTSFHYTALQSLDPYLFAGVGAGAFGLSARVRGWPDAPRARRAEPYIRIEAGGGAAIRLTGRWHLAVELRYILSVQVSPIDRFLITDGDTGETAVFLFAPAMRPPTGFSWTAGAGYRF